MASGSSSPADAGNVASAAQRLLQEHSSHRVTLETVPDEEDLKHEATLRAETASDAPGPAPTDAPAASWAATPSAKAAGKQKAEPVPDQTIDTHSHELFPELGAPKKAAAANVAPVWSAKAGGAASNGAKDGASSPATSNGSNSDSAPAAARSSGPPSLNIPGRNVSSVSLEEHQVLPRNSLKRPIPDLIKDINRKSRANITMLPPTGGRRQFNATGPPEVAQQALRDLVQQIGAKVRRSSLSRLFAVMQTWQRCSDHPRRVHWCAHSCVVAAGGRWPMLFFFVHDTSSSAVARFLVAVCN